MYTSIVSQLDMTIINKFLVRLSVREWVDLDLLGKVVIQIGHRASLTHWIGLVITKKKIYSLMRLFFIVIQ